MEHWAEMGHKSECIKSNFKSLKFYGHGMFQQVHFSKVQSNNFWRIFSDLLNILYKIFASKLSKSRDIFTTLSSIYDNFFAKITVFLKKTPYRSSHLRCSVRKSALRNFAKFAGKHLCQSLFFNISLL